MTRVRRWHHLSRLALDTVTSAAARRPIGMSGRRIAGRLSVGLLACALAGCATTGPSRGPDVISAPPTPAGPNAEPTAAASLAAADSVPADAPTVLEVVCDGTTTRIRTRLVKAQADGVHIRVTNTSGHALDLGIEDLFGGENIPNEGATYVYTFGPGGYRLMCGGTGMAFDVVDPDLVYTPAELLCDGRFAGSVDHAQGAHGPRGPLLDVARQELRGTRSDDVIERAGYPAATGDQLVRVVRAGQVVAVLRYASDGHGGWLLGGTQTCGGSEITVTEPDASATPTPRATSVPSTGGSISLRRAPANLGCDAMAPPYHATTIHIDPKTAEPVWAIADDGHRLGVLWSAGFRGVAGADPRILGPKGEVVARDGERIVIPGAAWPRLHGYFVCPSTDDLYVLETDPA